MTYTIVIWLTFSLGFCHAVVEHALDDQPLTNRVHVSDEIIVEWQFVRDLIIFRVSARTKGWVGIGISPNPSMEGADLMLAGVRDGSVYVLDAHSGRNGLPSLDEDQYVDILSGSENETHTTVTILRRRETFDLEDVSVEHGVSYYLLWAFGSTDITGTSFTFRHYHRRNRGSFDFMSTNNSTEEYPTTVQNEVPEVEATPFSTTQSAKMPSQSNAVTSTSNSPTNSETHLSQTAVTDPLRYDVEESSVNVTLADPKKTDGSKKYEISAAFAFVALVLLMAVAKKRLATFNA